MIQQRCGGNSKNAKGREINSGLEAEIKKGGKKEKKAKTK